MASPPTAGDVRSLTRDDLGGWVDLCVDVFGGKQPRSYFESHVNDDPFLSALSPSDILVIDVDGQIASSLRLVPRQVYINGGTIVHTVGLAEVATRAQYRSRGLSSRLISHALSIVEKQTPPISVVALHTRSAAGHYRRFGWQAYPADFLAVDIRPVLPAPDVHCKALDLRRPDVCNDVLDIYSGYSSRFDGTTVRNLSYMMRWVARRHERRGDIVAAGLYDASSKMIAYAFAARPRDANGLVELDEIGLRDPHDRNALATLLTYVVEGKSDLKVKLPYPIAIDIGVVDADGSGRGDPGLADAGVMYRIADTAAFSRPLTRHHVVWPTDAY